MFGAETYSAALSTSTRPQRDNRRPGFQHPHRVLSNAVRTLPPASRPAIVSVSVNPWGDSRANFRADAKHWGLDAAWRWAIGPRPQLAAVWQKYEISVQVVTKRVAGVAVRRIAHNEVSCIVDRAGYQRALFIYPFTAGDVEHEIHKLDTSS
jgi:cytochrome oxidase Cu insertion factor (SCO1/SenC/PrrC family)